MCHRIQHALYVEHLERADPPTPKANFAALNNIRRSPIENCQQVEHLQRTRVGSWFGQLESCSGRTV